MFESRLETQAAQPDLEQAILNAVYYADIFDFPLTSGEIQRYLPGRLASLQEVEAALNEGNLVPRFLCCQGGYYALAGREAIVENRQERAGHSARLWSGAIRYGRMIARLPFVRMVAVTGALAMDNEAGRDIDYLIVTQTGRLWLCRALVILLVRWASRRGDIICPNYFLSQRALAFIEQNLYTAHELAQMVPLSGKDIYLQIRQANPWMSQFLPNAEGPPTRENSAPENRYHSRFQAFAEALLRTSFGERLERWEMDRKLVKFGKDLDIHPEAAFSADWCKGHFGGHGRRTMAAVTRQLNRAGS